MYACYDCVRGPLTCMHTMVGCRFHCLCKRLTCSEAAPGVRLIWICVSDAENVDLYGTNLQKHHWYVLLSANKNGITQTVSFISTSKH